MSPTSDSVSEESLKRRRVSLCQGQSPPKQAKHFPCFPLHNHEVITRLEAVLEGVRTSLFSLPFLISRPDQDVISCKPRSIEDVTSRLQRGDYTYTQEVFLDLELVFELGLESGGLDLVMMLVTQDCPHTVRMTAGEVRMMAATMRTTITMLIEQYFSDNFSILDNPVKRTKNYSDLDEEIVITRIDGIKISEQSHKEQKPEKMPRTPVILKTPVMNKNKQREPPETIKVFRFYHRHKHQMNEEHVLHNYIAGFHFHRMMAKWNNPDSKIPVPLRRVSNTCEAISHIDYVSNPRLQKEFEAQRQKFSDENKDMKEILLFYGTYSWRVNNIITRNISIDHEEKDKRMIFGKGIYFSELPAISLMYGNGLVLCKVLLGNCEQFQPTQTNPQPGIPPGFDSREVLTKEGCGVIHVVRSRAQVLPYCVIHLKKESLGSDVKNFSNRLTTNKQRGSS